MYDKAMQEEIFGRFGATYTRTHDVRIQAATLPGEQRDAILVLESYGVGPHLDGTTLVVPCFFRSAVADILLAVK